MLIAVCNPRACAAARYAGGKGRIEVMRMSAPDQALRLLLQRLPYTVGEQPDGGETAHRQAPAPAAARAIPGAPVAAQEVEGEAEEVHYLSPKAMIRNQYKLQIIICFQKRLTPLQYLSLELLY